MRDTLFRSRVALIRGHALALRPTAWPPYSRPITRRSVFGALQVCPGPAPVSAAALARMLTRAPQRRHVERVARCVAALLRAQMVPEELVGGETPPARA